MLKLFGIKISNFKNFQDISLSDIETSGAMAFLGSNGVGKSNFLQILEFVSLFVILKDITKVLRKLKVSQKELFYNYDLTRNIRFNFNFKDTENKEVCYEFVLISSSDKIVVKSEEISVRSGNKFFKHNFLEENQFSSLLNISKVNKEQQNIIKSNEENSIVSKYENDVLKYLTKISSYYSYKSTLKEISVIDKAGFSTLEELLLYLKLEEKNLYIKVIEGIKSNVDVFVDLHFDIEDNQVKIFCETLFSKVRIPLKDLSKGMLKIIILFSILNLPTYLRPSLMILEEPDIYIHPHVLFYISELINEYTLDNQILLTTQSPFLLNKVEFSDIFVFGIDKDKNLATVNHIKTKNIQHLLKSYSLGDIWVMNILGGTPLS